LAVKEFGRVDHLVNCAGVCPCLLGICRSSGPRPSPTLEKNTDSRDSL
jgi:NAD(P)-dependent dehydrogenase (short-subunit alcohol dehydrogenase family)